MQRFDIRNPNFGAFNRPSRIEADIFELEIEGEVPLGLNGYFLRQTADPQFHPVDEMIVVEPDGLVNSFHIANGHVDFRSRYVRTERFLKEREARRALFGRYRNPYADDEEVKGVDRSTANTSLLWHHGKLLALKEDGLPYELDPTTLETKGRYDFCGDVKSQTMTAHPRIDPDTSELFFYGASASGDATPEIAYYVADAEGNITAERWFKAPYSSIVHDFVVTKNWAIFPIMPAVSSLERLQSRGPIYEWESERPSFIGVLPRDGSSEPRWFETDPMFAFHMVNAFDDGSNLVTIDAMESPVFPMWFPTDEQKAAFARGTPPKDEFFSQLTRWTIDLGGEGRNAVSRSTLHEWDAEMPRMDDRFACTPYRYAFYSADDPSQPIVTTIGERGVNHNSIARWDHETQSLSSWHTGANSAVGEPVFVPRSPDEGDGWLLAVVQRYQDMSSELVILDAQKLENGPVARVFMPMRLKNGIHGAWLPIESDY